MTSYFAFVIQDNEGINWNTKNKDGDPLIFTALKNNDLELFKILSTIPTVNWEITDNADDTVEDVARQDS